MLETIQRLFSYDRWAIDRILDSFKSAPATNQKALNLLAHLLLAEKIWLLRLKGEDTSKINKSPESSVSECESLASDLRVAYAEFLGSLDQDDLPSLINYKNFAGAEFHTPLQEILMHVALHGVYHRGQIALAVRAEGGPTGGYGLHHLCSRKARGLAVRKFAAAVRERAIFSTNNRRKKQV